MPATPRRPTVALAARRADIVLDRGGIGAVIQLHRHLEIHEITGIIFDDAEQAGIGADRFGGGEDLLGRGEEDFAGDGGASSMPRPTRPA